VTALRTRHVRIGSGQRTKQPDSLVERPFQGVRCCFDAALCVYASTMQDKNSNEMRQKTVSANVKYIYYYFCMFAFVLLPA